VLAGNLIAKVAAWRHAKVRQPQRPDADVSSSSVRKFMHWLEYSLTLETFGFGAEQVHSALPPVIEWPGRVLVVRSHSDLTRSVPVRKGVPIECEAGNGRRVISLARMSRDNLRIRWCHESRVCT
jgi:hypothetical protein